MFKSPSHLLWGVGGVASVCFHFPSSMQTKTEILQAVTFTVAPSAHFFWDGELALESGLWVLGILNYLRFLLLGYLQTRPATLKE